MRIFRKITISCIVSTLFPAICYAQQEPAYTHYMYNPLTFNPAYAGTRESLSFTGLYRHQWTGFDGAPKTISFNGHTPLPKNTGLGLSFVSDKAGPITTNLLNADVSYRLKLNEQATLSFGLKAGVTLFSGNLTQLKPTINYNAANPGTADPAIALGSVNNYASPNTGFGLYYYTSRFYAGISCPQLFQTKVATTEIRYNNTVQNTSLLIRQRHYYGSVGTSIQIAPDILFKPCALLKLTAGAPLQGDFTASFRFIEKFEAGVMYRTGDAFGGLLGVNISPQWIIGYSYDWSLAAETGVKSGSYNFGSHELMMRYDLTRKEKPSLQKTENQN